MEKKMVSKLKLLVLVGAVAGLALSPACKKDGDKKDGEKNEEGGDSAGKAGSSGSSSASALAYLPASAKVVIGMNLTSASKAPILAKFKDKLIEQMAGDISEVQKECGMDFTKDISNLTIGMVSKENFVMVLSGNFDQAKVEGCLTAGAKKEGKEFKATDEGKLRIYDTGEKEKMAAYWPSANTAVLTQHKTANLLSDIMSGSSKLGGDVMALTKSTKTTSTFWAVGKPGDLLKGAPVKGVDSFGATIDAGDTLDIKALINFADENKAKEANGMAGMGLAMAKGQPAVKPFLSIIEKLKMEQDGKAMKIGISLSGADVDLIEKNAGGMMR